ncbi:zinc-ribbon domain-containing protein [Neobacillus sp. PS3-12]|uniref:zinc-ribbon domain-containing protein n=1 Tax=Neobacillus sp. PS3-12 TaxID=3070677 RepID=UPI0027DF9D44|nr:zinc-ribbon domain-containing protein [Neobacillus sp. PS3-12]WML54345.1 zinc-ribbon domain-containing protein [Neobacillus sp. PS3-12]
MSIVTKTWQENWTKESKQKWINLGYKYTALDQIFEIAEQHAAPTQMCSLKRYPVKLNSANKKHYTNAGYKWTFAGDTIMVLPSELTKGSHTEIMCICDECNKVIQNVVYKDYLKTTKDETIPQKCGKCGNSIRKSKDEYKSQLKKVHGNDYLLIGEYEGMHKATLHKHVSCGTIKEMIPHDLLKRQGCFNCNSQLYIDESNCLAATHKHLLYQWDYEQNPILPTDIKAGSNIKVYWICPDDIRHKYPMVIAKKALENRGCPICSGKLVHETNCLQTTHPKMSKMWDYEKNGDVTPRDVTYGSNKKYFWICAYGHPSYKSKVKQISRGEGCPICQESKGNKYIRNWLESVGLKFSREEKFHGLKVINQLKFDFFVDNSQGKVLIEFHGKQHYQYHEFFHNGSRKNLKKQFKYDGVKRKFAKENQIPLIVIPYKLNGKQYNEKETIKCLKYQLNKLNIYYNQPPR